MPHFHDSHAAHDSAPWVAHPSRWSNSRTSVSRRCVAASRLAAVRVMRSASASISSMAVASMTCCTTRFSGLSAGPWRRVLLARPRAKPRRRFAGPARPLRRLPTVIHGHSRPELGCAPSDVKGKVKSLDETVRVGTTALARLTSPRSPRSPRHRTPKRSLPARARWGEGRAPRPQPRVVDLGCAQHGLRPRSPTSPSKQRLVCTASGAFQLGPGWRSTGRALGRSGSVWSSRASRRRAQTASPPEPVKTSVGGTRTRASRAGAGVCRRRA
jgi:hypothetical protein